MIVWLSQILIPFIVCYIVGFGLICRRPVFEDFLTGAKSGMKTVVEILPTLVGLMTAVGVLRVSGFLDLVSGCLQDFARLIHFPVELIPLTLVRLISNSAATGLLLDIFQEYGTDSFLGMAASILMSSTETVFYCISVYCGAVNVTKTRYLLPGALLATAAGVAASIVILRIR